MSAWLALAGMLVATAVFLVYETRDTMFWIDEWTWVLERRGSDLGTYLEPHNGHLSLVPVALYKLLFEIAGTDGYTPFRLPVIAAHLILAVLTFVYARPRVGSILALLATALILGLAPGWQNIMWGFQVGRSSPWLPPSGRSSPSTEAIVAATGRRARWWRLH